MKTLIVYYSMKGTTKRVAAALADRLGCDIEGIASMKNRKGLWGFVISGFEAALKRPGAIHPTKLDPADYDLVLVGTPVWGNGMSSLTRSYLMQNRAKLGPVAFFATCSSSGIDSAFRSMGETCGKTPVGVLGLTSADFKEGSDAQKIDAFVRQVLKKRSEQ